MIDKEKTKKSYFQKLIDFIAKDQKILVNIQDWD